MGGMMIWGMAMPEYREGDSVSPGRPVADVIEAGRMEMRAKVDENDRANLSEGQEASVEVDSIAGQKFPAKVGALSGLASRGEFFESSGVTRQFDVTFQFLKPEPRMKAGASARVTIDGKEMKDALTVPRQAVFQKNGKTHVFVKTGDRFDQREVKIVQRTESRAALEGLPEGTEIALVDPTIVRAKGPSGTSPLPAAGAPR
jgi:multidrug efflux pump subunit AcrA (membrane-fusion protein)